jgi:LuxR family maltose regulon positive regulatory protein
MARRHASEVGVDPVSAGQPGQPNRILDRPSLFGKLSNSPPGNVTLLCAPAGSGKTTLLRSWLANSGLKAAWVSVACKERDATRFWRSVVGELGSLTGHPCWSQEVDPAPDAEIDNSLLLHVIAKLNGLDESVLLVIDNLEQLHSQEANAQLEQFIQHRPQQLRMLIATRREPWLGLHKLRVTGELTELRTADLRFSLDDSERLLRDAGIRASAETAQLLHTRTEGWAAGIRLVALALSTNPNPQRFVEEFCGLERTIAHYLRAEVLSQQPADVLSFLMRISVVARINGPLATTLTGNAASEQMLQDLEDSNAFVTSLDVGRSWFRCHPLLRDLLQQDLRRTCAHEVAKLHQSAANWFEEHGYLFDAIAHAQAASAWPQAVRLVADVEQLRIDSCPSVVRSLLDKFPEVVAEGRPELQLAHGLLRFRERSSLEEVAAHYSAAERLADLVPGQRRAKFTAALTMGTMALASRCGDFETVFRKSEELSGALPGSSGITSGFRKEMRALSLVSTGTAHFWSCDLDQARDCWEDGLVLARELDRPDLELAYLSRKGLATASRRHSLELSQAAIQIAIRQGWAADPIATFSHASLGYVLAWTGQFENAQRSLQQAYQSHRPRIEPETDFLIELTRGLIFAGRNLLAEALTALTAAEQIGAGLCPGHPLASGARRHRLHVQVRLGQVDTVRTSLMTQDPLRHQDFYAAVASTTVLASVLLAEDDQRSATEILAPLTDNATGLRPMGTTIQALLLAAVAYSRLGNAASAHLMIERALEFAERDGIVFPFTQVPVSHLLQRHPRYNTAHASLIDTIQEVLNGTVRSPDRLAPGSAEKLGPAELRVLGYLPSSLSVSEIAAELCLSVNTVKTHLRNIYAKLHAHRRVQAVEIARKTGLLAPTPTPSPTDSPWAYDPRDSLDISEHAGAAADSWRSIQ